MKNPEDTIVDPPRPVHTFAPNRLGILALALTRFDWHEHRIRECDSPSERSLHIGSATAYAQMLKLITGHNIATDREKVMEVIEGIRERAGV